jgi:hypothetical protein
MARASVLTLKETKTKVISFKISDQLNAKLEALDKRLSSEAPDAEFDRGTICTKALEDAVELANDELNKRKSA